MRIVGATLMVTVSLLLSGCSIQDRLLYYPGRGVPTEAEAARLGMRFWPVAGKGYRGFVGEASPAARGTIIVFHGNAGTAADRFYYLQPLSRLGFRVILAEYQGYGNREGKPGEAAFVKDARETVRLAAEAYGGPVYLLGESLGAAVVPSAVRGAGVQVAGLILITPWATLEKVAREKFPWLPVRWLLTDRYDTVANLRPYPGRVAVVAAERDDIVPPHHARELFDAFHGPKRLCVVPGAGHNDWPDFVSEATWGDIIRFLMR